MPTSWPSTVPLRFETGATFGGPTNTFLTTQFDKGPPQRRRNTLASTSPVSLRLAYLTQAEFAAFEAWFHTTLQGGALTFEMVHPLTGELRQWAFGEVYSYDDLNGSLVSVSLPLVLYPHVE